MSDYIGLLMVNNEDDILERTLEHNAQFLDAFYVLDGTLDNKVSEDICRSHPKCWGYRTDSQLPRPPYSERVVCGYRQFMLQHALQDHGPYNWFLVLHADEIWTQDPHELVREDRNQHDGFIYRLPFFFPRQGEPWDDEQHPIDQLHWQMGPGWPEFRLFKGNPSVRYDPLQEFNTRPQGIHKVAYADAPILHYPFRSPQVQRARALQHTVTQFDPSNYEHINEDDAVYWTDEMIAAWQGKQHYSYFHSARVTALFSDYYVANYSIPQTA